ncbi:MAG: hypothetical protein ACRDIV_10060 [Ktedonobacteraceae bacterium]
MIQLSQSDFRPGDSFELWWRWANPKWVSLPESVLFHIRSLTVKKTREIWQTEFVYITELRRYAFDTAIDSITSSSLFDQIRHVDLSIEKIDVVQQHLTAFEPQGDQMVIVMWEPTIAVAVPWHIFCSYFWDFCYPVTDDVRIWSISELWCLQYHHEDQLIFGRTRLPLLDEEARMPQPVQAKPLIRRDELIHLIQANKIVAAIRLYHDDTGVSYREAKDAVEKLATEINDGKGL